jgi:predicted lipoprotein with Yx(FWY)xxD motif
MKPNQLLIAALAFLAIAVSACGPSSVGAAPANQAPAANPPAAAVAAPTEAPTPDSSTTESGSGSVATVAPTPDSSTSESGSQPAAVPAQSGATAVNLNSNSQFGSILVDGKGMTLYLFTKDTPNTSNCYDKCATAWPPLLTTGSPTAGDGIDASKLGTTTRTDGTTQVTYNGWPLYYFAKDQQAGDTAGQGVGSVWYVISPAGTAIQ